MVPTLICVGKHNICVGNCEIILIENREIKRPRIYVMISKPQTLIAANLNGVTVDHVDGPVHFLLVTDKWTIGFFRPLINPPGGFREPGR